MAETSVKELSAHLTREEDGKWVLSTPEGQVPSFKERGELVRDIFPILMSLDLGMTWAEAWLDLYKRHPKTDQMAGAIVQLERIVALERAAHG